MTGFVYAIGDGRGHVKIGWSEAPDQRLVQIQIGTPSRVSLLGVVEATQEQEAEAHKVLGPWIERGEWFRLVGPVLAFVAMLRPWQPKRIEVPDNAHPLTKWLASCRMTQTQFAKSVGISPAMVTQIISNRYRQMPSMPVAQRIVELTTGAVTFDDLVKPGRTIQ